MNHIHRIRLLAVPLAAVAAAVLTFGAASSASAVTRWAHTPAHVHAVAAGGVTEYVRIG